MKFLLISISIFSAPLFSFATNLDALSKYYPSDRQQKSLVELREVLDEYTDLFKIPSTGINEFDKDEAALCVARMISSLDPMFFNETVYKLGNRYRLESENRKALDLLFIKLHEQILPDIMSRNESRAIFTVVDDIFWTFGAVYVVGAGKGLVLSRGSQLRGIERWRHAMALVQNNLPTARRAAVISLTGGSAIGGFHALYNYLEVKRIDPREVIRIAQKDVVYSLAGRAKLLLQTRQPKSTVEFKKIEDECAYLYLAAPRFRPQLDAIAEDLRLAADSIN